MTPLREQFPKCFKLAKALGHDDKHADRILKAMNKQERAYYEAKAAEMEDEEKMIRTLQKLHEKKMIEQIATVRPQPNRAERRAQKAEARRAKA